MDPISPKIFKICWSFNIYVLVKHLTGSKVCIEVLNDNEKKVGTKIYNQTNKQEYNDLNTKICELYLDFYDKIMQKFDKKTITKKLEDYAKRNQNTY